MKTFFEDTFTVSAVDPEGKRFDRVSRVNCDSVSASTIRATFDYHCQLFPLKTGDKVKLILSYDEESAVDVPGDYVTNNIIFKIEQNDQNINVIMSAGGLLTSVKADISRLGQLSNGQKIKASFSKIK
jgi:hypothetical protein